MPPADLSQFMNQNRGKAHAPAAAPAAAAPALGSGRGQHKMSSAPSTSAQAAALGGSPRRGSSQAEAFRAMAKMSVLLRKHPPESQAYIQRSCKLIKVAAGDTVYTQGAASDAFYMIESGRFVAEANSTAWAQ